MNILMAREVIFCNKFREQHHEELTTIRNIPVVYSDDGISNRAKPSDVIPPAPAQETRRQFQKE